MDPEAVEARVLGIPVVARHLEAHEGHGLAPRRGEDLHGVLTACVVRGLEEQVAGGPRGEVCLQGRRVAVPEHLRRAEGGAEGGEEGTGGGWRKMGWLEKDGETRLWRSPLRA